MSHPETAVCIVCGETAYLDVDGDDYCCNECGCTFDDDEIEDEIEDDEYDFEDIQDDHDYYK